jgi:hypothetical protein
MTRPVWNSNLTWIPIDLQFGKSCENLKGRLAQLTQRTSACPACLLSSPQPTLILAHSGPTAFPACPRVAHLTSQWPAPAHPDSFVLTTLAEADRVPTPRLAVRHCSRMSHRPRLCPHAPVLGIDSIVKAHLRKLFFQHPNRILMNFISFSLPVVRECTKSVPLAKPS